MNKYVKDLFPDLNYAEPNAPAIHPVLEKAGFEATLANLLIYVHAVDDFLHLIFMSLPPQLRIPHRGLRGRDLDMPANLAKSMTVE